MAKRTLKVLLDVDTSSALKKVKSLKGEFGNMSSGMGNMHGAAGKLFGGIAGGAAGAATGIGALVAGFTALVGIMQKIEAINIRIGNARAELAQDEANRLSTAAQKMGGQSAQELAAVSGVPLAVIRQRAIQTQQKIGTGADVFAASQFPVASFYGPEKDLTRKQKITMREIQVGVSDFINSQGIDNEAEARAIGALALTGVKVLGLKTSQEVLQFLAQQFKGAEPSTFGPAQFAPIINEVLPVALQGGTSKERVTAAISELSVGKVKPERVKTALLQLFRLGLKTDRGDVISKALRLANIPENTTDGLAIGMALALAISKKQLTIQEVAAGSDLTEEQLETVALLANPESQARIQQLAAELKSAKFSEVQKLSAKRRASPVGEEIELQANRMAADEAMPGGVGTFSRAADISKKQIAGLRAADPNKFKQRELEFINKMTGRSFDAFTKEGAKKLFPLLEHANAVLSEVNRVIAIFTKGGMAPAGISLKSFIGQGMTVREELIDAIDEATGRELFGMTEDFTGDLVSKTNKAVQWLDRLANASTEGATGPAADVFNKSQKEIGKLKGGAKGFKKASMIVDPSADIPSIKPADIPAASSGATDSGTNVTYVGNQWIVPGGSTGFANPGDIGQIGDNTAIG